MGAVAGGKGEEVCGGVRLKTKRPNKDSNEIFKIPIEVTNALAVKMAYSEETRLERKPDFRFNYSWKEPEARGKHKYENHTDLQSWVSMSPRPETEL